MSKLEVDTIAPQSGTTVTVGESGDTVTIPTGVTLDASNATTTLPSNIVTTDGTQTLTNKSIDASQLSGTITPSDNTVSLAKLTATGTKDATTFLRGDNTFAEAGGGKLLQVVEGVKTTEFSTTSGTYVATGLSVNITPSSTSSKILVISSAMYIHTRGDIAVYGTIFRDSTNLAPTNGFFYHFDPSNNADENRFPASMQVLDSPSTTSQITYQVYIHSGSAGQTVKITPSNLRNSIIAMEIGA